MMSFRQKIFISYVLVFILFIAVMFPFASRTVKKIVNNSIRDRTSELIAKIQTATDDDALIQRLKDQKYLIFFRVSVITNERKVLYDSYTKRLLGPSYNKKLANEHPEVEEAFNEGIGYHEDYSYVLKQKFSYIAKAFNFHGKTYVLRAAFPYKFIEEMTRDFEIGFLTIATAAFLLISIMTWFIIGHLTAPIQQIIQAVKPYQEGEVAIIPEIKLQTLYPSTEFGDLAKTLNSLSSRIQNHIDSLTHERNEKEVILESLIEGVIAVDIHMHVTYANNTALKLLDLKSSDLIDHHFNVADEPKSYALLVACQKEKKVLQDTLHLKRKRNKSYFDIIAAPTKDNSGAILVMQDKSVHYKLLEMRKDFIANASHELKTPITIIHGFAEALHDNPDLPKSAREEITEKIQRNCQRMTNLIKDLLALTDIDNIPQSRLVVCNLYDLTVICCNMIKDVAPDADIQIHSDVKTNFLITADINLMELAIVNLVENAVKYSTPPAKVTITLSENSNEMILAIADKGIGIPEADLERIFERFYTVNKAHSRKMGGSGLGLSIVQTIVEKHFGTISVSSQLGVGTTFTIRLPKKLTTTTIPVIS